MVKLRVAARVIPENQYLNAAGFNSTATLVGERRFLVIVRNPDEDYYIGTLAREVQERYKSIYKHDLGKIKYIKDNEDDCDLDPEQLVYDLLIDEGKAAVDAADQHVSIKFIQEQGGALRAGSVIPDLTPVHYVPRPRPPVPKFPTLSSLGKRASPYNPNQSPAVGSWNGKRPRLSETDDDGLVRSIETDATSPEIGQKEGNMWPDIVQESQVSQVGLKNQRAPAQAGNSPNSLLPAVTGHLRPKSSSRQTSGYYSPVVGPNQSGPEEESTGMERSSSGRQQIDPSRSKRFPLKEHLGSSRAPITPPSDGSRDRYSTGNNLLSLKPKSSGARASSTSSKRFKSHQPVEQESDIEDTQMSPRSKSKGRLKITSGPLSRPLVERERLVESGDHRQDCISGSRQKIVDEVKADGQESEEETTEDEAAAGDDADETSSSPGYESGNVPGLLFTAKGAEGSLNDVGPGKEIKNVLEESPVPTDIDVGSDKENETQAKAVAWSKWSESGFGILQDLSTAGPQKSATPAEPAGVSQTTATSSKAIQQIPGTPISNRATNDSIEASQTPSKASAIRQRKRVKRKSAAGDLSSLDGSQVTQPNVLPPKRKSAANTESIVERLNKASNPSFKLQVPKVTTSSSRGTSVSDSAGEQLANDLSQSARKPASAQSSKSTKEKKKPEKRKVQKKKDPTPENKLDGKEAVGAVQPEPKGKPKKDQNPSKTSKARKTTKKSQALPTNTTQTEESTNKDIFDIGEVLSSPPRGSMGLGITDSPKKEKLPAVELSSEPLAKSDVSKVGPNSKLKPKTGKGKLTDTKSGSLVHEESQSKSSISPIVMQAQIVSDATPTTTSSTKTGRNLASKVAKSSGAVRRPVLPQGMTRNEYSSATDGKKINPLSATQKEENAAEYEESSDREDELEAEETPVTVNVGKAAEAKKVKKKEKEPKIKKAAVGKAVKSGTSSATTNADQKPDLPVVKSKAEARSKSTGSSETNSLNIPKAASSRKSIEGSSKREDATKAMAEASSDYADMLARCQATVKPREQSSVNSSGAAQEKRSQLKAEVAPPPPAPSTANRSIRQLHEQIRNSQPTVQAAKQSKQTAAKRNLAMIAAMEESSDDESSDDEPPRGKAFPVAVNVPDPATRDPTPSSDDDDESVDEL